MTLTKPEKIQIQKLIYQFRYIFGRKPDSSFKYPQGLEDIMIIRYLDNTNPINPLNGKVGLLIAYTASKDEPVVLFEMNWIETTREKLTYIRRLNENYLWTRDEWIERRELQAKLKPITDNDIMDLYNELEIMDHGIIINKELL